MALDVSMILRLVDRLSAPAKRAQAAVKALAGANGLGGMSRAGQVASRGMERAERAAGRMGMMMTRAKAKVDALALRALPTLNKAAERAGAGLGNLIKGAGGLALGAAKWAVGGAVAGIGLLGKGVIGVGSQFEDFGVQLEQLEGSKAKARQSLDWISKFATQTPYELDQVTDAFVRARGVGIDPMSGSLRTMGDAAAANRASMLDAIEAVADAQTGEFERLKSFNITSSTKGDMVTFSYFDKQGKQTATSVKKSASEIQRAILSIWDQKHSGSMTAMSKTLTGIIGNLKDFGSRALLKIANAGAFDKLKARAEGLLARLNEFEASGKLDQWADRISSKFETLIDRAFDFVEGTDWAAAAAGMAGIAEAAVGLLGIIGSVVEKWNQFNAMRERTLLNTAASGQLGDKYVGPAKKRLAELDRADPSTKTGRLVKGLPSTAGVKAEHRRGFIGPVNRSLSSGSPPANWPARKGLRVGSNQSVDVKNRVEVAIFQPAGMQTRVSGTPASGGGLTVTKQVNRGVAMAGSGRAAA